MKIVGIYAIIKHKLNIKTKRSAMVEPLLSGIVLGMISVSALGLFVAAFLQYRRGNQLEV